MSWFQLLNTYEISNSYFQPCLSSKQTAGRQEWMRMCFTGPAHRWPSPCTEGSGAAFVLPYPHIYVMSIQPNWNPWSLLWNYYDEQYRIVLEWAEHVRVNPAFSFYPCIQTSGFPTPLSTSPTYLSASRCSLRSPNLRSGQAGLFTDHLHKEGSPQTPPMDWEITQQTEVREWSLGSDCLGSNPCSISYWYWTNDHSLCSGLLSCKMGDIIICRS